MSSAHEPKIEQTAILAMLKFDVHFIGLTKAQLLQSSFIRWLGMDWGALNASPPPPAGEGGLKGLERE